MSAAVQRKEARSMADKNPKHPLKPKKKDKSKEKKKKIYE